MKLMYYTLGGHTGKFARFSLGASCYLFIVTVCGRTWRFIIDCGLEPANDTLKGWRSIDLPKLEQLLGDEKIDAIFLTHAHLDHCGYIPALMSFLSRDAKIICTTTTAKLFEHALNDAFNQAERRIGALKPFEFQQKMFTIGRIQVVLKPSVLKFTKGIEILVWPAGHINGACSFFFRFAEGKKRRTIAFLGDYSLHDQIAIQGAPLPPEEWLLTGENDAIAVQDCTNGDDEIPVWQDEMDRLMNDSDSWTLQGGKWIETTFSIVRWQVLIHERARRQIEKYGRVQYPMYGDGSSGYKVAGILAETKWWGDSQLDISEAFRVDRKKREILCGIHRGLTITTPSGMGHGPASSYLATCLSDTETKIVSTGYAAPGTNIHEVLWAKNNETVMIEGAGDVGEDGVQRTTSTVRAERAQYRLSAHQPRLDMVQRTCELFGATPLAIQRWNEDGRSKNIVDSLYIRNLKRIEGKHVGLRHGSSLAFDWFENYFSGWIQTSRGDHELDRALEL